MPPRYAYWTILIDDKPTAFRAREREELQPTFVQLQRKNPKVTMQWFARGKLWASREAERDDFQLQKHAAAAPREKRDPDAPRPERRGSDWRPGGAHKDPRDRFKKKNRPERAWSEKDPATQRDRDKPGYVAKPRPEWRDKPAGPPRGDRPWQNKPPSGEKRPWQDRPPAHRSSSDRPRSEGGRDRKPWDKKAPVPNDRPWQTKPTGPRAQRKPWVGKPGPPEEGAGFKPRGDRPPDHRSSSDRRPSGGGWTPPGEKRPWSNKPPSGEKRPWTGKPSGPPRGDRPPAGERRPWSGKPSGPPRERKPWSDKPAGGPPRGDRPWNNKPAGEKRPWSGKPSGDRPPHRNSPDRRPSGGGIRPSGPPRDGESPVRRSSPDRRRSAGGKKRDDEPPDRG